MLESDKCLLQYDGIEEDQVHGHVMQKMLVGNDTTDPVQQFIYGEISLEYAVDE